MKWTIQWVFVCAQAGTPSPISKSRTLSLPQEETHWQSLSTLPSPPQLLTQPRQPLTYFLCLWTCLFRTLHTNRISLYAVSCVWLLLFSTMLSGFLYVVCRMYHYFIPFCHQIIFHCMDIPYFAYAFTSGWAFWLFLHFGYCEYSCMIRQV